MVAIATGLGRTGFQDWFIQRVTAVIVGIYTLGLIIAICSHPGLTFSEWSGWFECAWLKYATFMTLLALVAHAWIGIWTVTTDYIKCMMIRIPLQVIFILSLFVYIFWGIRILWGM